MEKLNDKQRNEIVLSYALDNSKQNIEKICRDYGITRQYIFKLAKKEKSQELLDSISKSKSEFTKRANDIIKQAFDKLEEKLENDDKTTVSQLATLIGILYDKSRLEENLSTNNSSININIKVEK